MATRLKTALREAKAVQRLHEATARIAASTGVTEIQVPVTSRRNVMTRTAETLEAFAEWAEAIGNHLLPPASPEGQAYMQDTYEDMTVVELRAMAAERGIDTTGFRLKGEYVDSLLAADGVTEREQAAEDGVSYAEDDDSFAEDEDEDDSDDDFEDEDDEEI